MEADFCEIGSLQLKAETRESISIEVLYFSRTGVICLYDNRLAHFEFVAIIDGNQVSFDVNILMT